MNTIAQRRNDKKDDRNAQVIVWDRALGFMPRLKTLSGYNLSWLGNDVAAGLSVAAIALR